MTTRATTTTTNSSVTSSTTHAGAASTASRLVRRLGVAAAVLAVSGVVPVVANASVSDPDGAVEVTNHGIIVSEPRFLGPFPPHAVLDADERLVGRDGEAESPPASSAFTLHSRPGADLTIHLDFDGHTTSGTEWNGGARPASFTSLPYSHDADSNFNTTELEYIGKIWELVAEDYAAFDVDVTTEDPGVDRLRRDSPADSQYGMRIVISETDDWYGSSGGVAFINSFPWVSSDAPAFVFTDALANGYWKFVGEAAAHEAGHTLGLYHDGNPSSGYYTGHGSGDDGWAPTMGIGYYKPVTQWSQGEYSGATETQDDMAILSSKLGLVGASAAPAQSIGHDADVRGIVDQAGGTTDYTVSVGAGSATITVTPVIANSNLLARLDLYRGGSLVAQATPTSASNWTLAISETLDADTYTIQVTSLGWLTANDGFTDYGSVGQFDLSVNAVDPAATTTTTTTTTTTPPPTTTTPPTTPPLGDRLTAITPRRLLDTRFGTGGSTRLAAGTSIRVGVTSDAAIPVTSTAAVLNVVAVEPAAAGFLEVTPCNSPLQRTASVNFNAGRTVANSTIAKLDAFGDVCIYAHVETDVVVDVAGWLSPLGDGGLQSRTAERVVDTREALGVSGRLAPSVSTRVDLSGTVPTGTQAIAVNLTAVGASSGGFVTAFPCSGGTPSTSSLNYSGGEVRGNNAIVALDPDRSFCLYSSADTDVVVDLTGHFENDGLTYIAATPSRLLDTRDGGPRLAGGTGIWYNTPDAPDGNDTVAASVVITAVDQSHDGYVTAWDCGPLPLAAALTASPGEANTNGAIVPVTSLDRSCLYVSTAAHLVVDFSGWWI